MTGESTRPTAAQDDMQREAMDLFLFEFACAVMAAHPRPQALAHELTERVAAVQVKLGTQAAGNPAERHRLQWQSQWLAGILEAVLAQQLSGD